MNKSNIYRQRRAKRPFGLSPKERGAITVTLLGIGLILFLVLGGQLSKAGRTEKLLTPDSLACLEHVVLPNGTTEQIVDYTGFTVSFNAVYHLPNYVVWELTGEEAQGTEPRKSKFKPDYNVTGTPLLSDYKNSGYDRGHMAPAGDMKWSEEAMDDSHYLTNMCPQDHSINSGRWSTLENKCRQWALRDSALIIIAGPILTDHMPETIGASRISVPKRFFKVILAPFNNPPTGIAFIMPNSPTSDGIESMATTIDKVEEITGYDFFACLPDDIENSVESECRYRYWNRKNR
ncbi:MAG: DNA/RNA non-specific endonuclease [Muribaculaceae bacterium]|nr:DNA/RNA non-specific endonuclease [Muribaculaceae bacterium]